MSTSLQTPRRPPTRRASHWWIAVAVAAVVGIVLVAVAQLRAPSSAPSSALGTGSAAGSPPAAGSGAAGSAVPGSAAGVPAAGSGAGAPAVGVPASPAGGAAAPAVGAVQWLWPFADQRDVAAWQRAHREGGHQPWHGDPAATALGFAGHLGYPGLDRVVRSTVGGAEAYVAVGFRQPDGSLHTAADVHLVAIGRGADRAWEVVGTRDTTLTLTTPAYGATVRSPITVGGRITGVDERVVVTLHTRTATVPGTAATEAGGENTGWSVPVRFGAAAGTLITVAAATGGHVAAVERFAVTAIRVAP
jgi:hypothetical protein